MATNEANHFTVQLSLTVDDNPTTPEHHNPINPPRRTIITNQMPDYLYIERGRLQTFQTWTKPFIAKEKLAMYGFFHCGPNDNVKCVFCKVEIGSWEVGDNVLREHLRWSPNCPLLKRRQTRNEPIDSESFERSLPPITVDTVGMHFPIEYRENSYPENEYYDQKYSLLKSLDYRKINDRLKSFSEWPKSMRQKPAELSDAGFFYTGKGDQVKCYSCDIVCKDWMENDVPWEQHVLLNSTCKYLNAVNSPAYIKRIKGKHATKNKKSCKKKNDYQWLAKKLFGIKDHFSSLMKELDKDTVHKDMKNIFYLAKLTDQNIKLLIAKVINKKRKYIYEIKEDNVEKQAHVNHLAKFAPTESILLGGANFQFGLSSSSQNNNSSSIIVEDVNTPMEVD